MLRSALRRAPWFLIVPVSLAAVLGLWGISDIGLWLDERFTADAALSGPLNNLWEAPQVPFYFVMQAWSLYGLVDNDSWFRAFSLVCMMLAVALVALTGRRLSGRKVGLSAGIILALAPGINRYSQEARVYALATMLVCAAIWFFVTALESQDRRWWIGYALAMMAVCGFAPFGLVALPAFAILLLLQRSWRSKWRQWLIATLAVIPVLIPQLIASEKFGFMHGWVPVPTIAELPTGLTWVMNYPAVWVNDWTAADKTFSVAVIALALMSSRGSKWLIAACSSVFLLWLVSSLHTSFWVVRSLIPISGFMALAAGFALAAAGWWRLLGLVVLLTALAWPSYLAAREPGARGFEVRQATAIIDSVGRKGDVISTVGANHDGLAWGYKRYGADPGSYAYAPGGSGRTWVLDATVGCRRLSEWPIAPNEQLVLCASVANDWNHVSPSS